MFSLDALKAEVAAKRKVLDDPAVAARPTKYMKRGDIERLREEKERQEAEERRKQQLEEEQAKRQAASAEAASKKASAAAKVVAAAAASSSSSSTGMDVDGQTSSSSVPLDSSVVDAVEAEKASPTSQLNTMSNEETIRRLRQKGQPIRLFAESDKDRRLRLRALELLDEKDHERHGGQNDFKKALEDVENTERENHSKGTKGKKKGADGNESGGQSVLDLGLIKSDPDKLYPIIYHALKRILKEWGESMDDRPIEVKQSRQGRLAAATQVQSAENLKPLFKQLRSRSLPSDMLARIAEIVHHVQNRQYQRANDSYLRLSIGNAPWPIGVTMVGIHERSAREKISADQVAHVLNDEVSRKYIQSLKRLITFSQTKYPPADISQLMG